MPQDKPEELFALKCSKARLSCFAFRVPEGYLSVLMGDYIPFTDYTPVQIPGQVRQGGDTGSHTDAVHDPFRGDTLGNGKFLFVQPVEKTGTKDFGEGFLIEQILALFLLNCRLRLSMPPPGTTTWICG